MKKNPFLKFAFLTALSVTIFSCSESSYDEQSQESPSEIQYKTSSKKVSNPGDQRIVFTQVVQLEGSQEVPTFAAPAVATETTGIAILRVSASKMLYSKVIIQNLAEGDMLRFSHVHAGAAGINGPVIINLADNPADFGVNKERQLTDAQFTLLTTGSCYVNVHSNFRPAGIVRGQIR